MAHVTGPGRRRKYQGAPSNASANISADGHPDAVPMATALTAVLRGLLDDLNTTADQERTTNGLRAIAKLLTPQSR